MKWNQIERASGGGGAKSAFVPAGECRDCGGALRVELVTDGDCQLTEVKEPCRFCYKGPFGKRLRRVPRF